MPRTSKIKHPLVRGCFSRLLLRGWVCTLPNSLDFRIPTGYLRLSNGFLRDQRAFRNHQREVTLSKREFHARASGQYDVGGSYSAIQPFVCWFEFYSSYCLFLNDIYIIIVSFILSRVKKKLMKSRATHPAFRVPRQANKKCPFRGICLPR